jgi:hypothetical protein
MSDLRSCSCTRFEVAHNYARRTRLHTVYFTITLRKTSPLLASCLLKCIHLICYPYISRIVHIYAQLNLVGRYLTVLADQLLAQRNVLGLGVLLRRARVDDLLPSLALSLALNTPLH